MDTVGQRVNVNIWGFFLKVHAFLFFLVRSLRVGISLQVTAQKSSWTWFTCSDLWLVIWRWSGEFVGSVQNLANNEVSRTVNHLKLIHSKSDLNGVIIEMIFSTTQQPSLLFTVACCQADFDLFLKIINKTPSVALKMSIIWRLLHFVSESCLLSARSLEF